MTSHDAVATDLMGLLYLEGAKADVDTETLTKIIQLYGALALVHMPLSALAVNTWNVGILGKKSAIKMHAIASIVKTGSQNGGGLPHVEILRAAYEQLAARTPKARKYVEPIDWTAAA